jgi:hypothetical protein
VIELVVPGSPTAHGSPTEEEQQPKDHDVEDKADEEYPPPSDTEDEKMYQDVDEVESFRAKALVPTGRLGPLHTWASQPPPGTGSRKSHVQGGWSSKPLQRSSSDPESSTDTRD